MAIMTITLLMLPRNGLLQKFGATPSQVMPVPMGFVFGTGMVFATIAIVEYVRQAVALLGEMSGRRTRMESRHGLDSRF